MARYLLPALIGLSSLVAGNVSVNVDDVKAIALDASGAVQSANQLFSQSCSLELANSTEAISLDAETGFKVKPHLLASSYAVNSTAFSNSTIYPSSSSLVRGAMEAWSKHQHLVIRPDEVWFEILTQLNFYMIKNAELVRHHFVSWSGQRAIEVLLPREEDMISQFGQKFQENVKTSWLLDWTKPGFSTSTPSDDLTAQVLLMGLTKQYMRYLWRPLCGIPSVTLLGERQDWVKLEEKLDHLSDFGAEAAEYATVLRPILRRFVKTWDEPESAQVKDFWSTMIMGGRKHVCGAVYDTMVNGWITGFYFWTSEGEVVGYQAMRTRFKGKGASLDDIDYIPRDISTIPFSYAKALVHVLDPDGRKNMDVNLVAGNIGIQRKTIEGKVTAQPLSAWFMYGPVDATEQVGDGGNRPEMFDISRSFALCSRDA